jgi:hypothetical protein
MFNQSKEKLKLDLLINATVGMMLLGFVSQKSKLNDSNMQSDAHKFITRMRDRQKRS